jgi:hypothetical protein
MKQPTTLNECLDMLTEVLPPSEVEKFKAMEEREAIARCHHGLGRMLRNNFNLWNESDLKTHFKDMGLWHADDMSGVIMTSFHRHLNGKDLNVEAQVKYYKDYWEKQPK